MIECLEKKCYQLTGRKAWVFTVNVNNFRFLQFVCLKWYFYQFRLVKVRLDNAEGSYTILDWGFELALSGGLADEGVSLHFSNLGMSLKRFLPWYCWSYPWASTSVPGGLAMQLVRIVFTTLRATRIFETTSICAFQLRNPRARTSRSCKK